MSSIVDMSTPICGFIVQGSIDESFINNADTYRGVSYRKSWPLEDYCDDVSIELTADMQKLFYRWHQGNFRLWICSDVSIIKKYSEGCRKNELEIRILSVRSLKYKGETYGDISETPLGFDFISPAIDYSPILEDFSVHRELFYPFVKLLNSNGLFDNMLSIQQYVEYRDKLIKSGHNIEDNSNLEIVMLAEVLVSTFITR